MALVKCAECGKEVSTLAAACPACGAPAPGSAGGPAAAAAPAPAATQAAPTQPTAPKRQVGFLLSLGIFFIPIVAAWFTLRKGHSTTSRVFAFSWLAMSVVAYAAEIRTPSETTTAEPATSAAAPSPQTIVASKPQAAPEPPPGPAIPSDEAKFIAANVAAQSAARSAANEMAKGGVRADRKAAICQALPGLSVRSWVGRIDTLSSNSDGKGVLGISLGSGVGVKTWNNSLSDIGDNTLIQPGSALFRIVSGMKKGDTVVFSGSFIQSDIDCVKEGSLTLSGSMSEPEFLFRFNSAARP